MYGSALAQAASEQGARWVPYRRYRDDSCSVRIDCAEVVLIVGNDARLRAHGTMPAVRQHRAYRVDVSVRDHSWCFWSLGSHDVALSALHRIGSGAFAAVLAAFNAPRCMAYPQTGKPFYLFNRIAPHATRHTRYMQTAIRPCDARARYRYLPHRAR